MDLTGEYIIPAPRQKVWEALNDADVLRACIPGCESLEKLSDTEMTATVVTKIGPVKAKFAGEVRLENINAPVSYTIAGEGKGGIAGFAKGGADVALEEVPEGTKLSYAVKAQIGGKLAQLGSRLIDSTVKKLADQFFQNFTDTLVAQGQRNKLSLTNQAARSRFAGTGKVVAACLAWTSASARLRCCSASARQFFASAACRRASLRLRPWLSQTRKPPMSKPLTKAAKMNTKKGSVSEIAGFSRENGSSSIVTGARFATEKTISSTATGTATNNHSNLFTGIFLSA